VTDFGSCWVQGSCLDSGRFCDDARLLPSHLPRMTPIISMLGHRSVRQASGGCPLSRVGHVGAEGGAKNPGESRQVITAIIQYCWTCSSLWPWYRLLAWKSLLGYIVNDNGAKPFSCSCCVARAQHDGEGLP
jgi:hypothetical protein